MAGFEWNSEGEVEQPQHICYTLSDVSQLGDMFYNCNPDRSNPECRSFAVFGELQNVDVGLSSIVFIVMCILEFIVLLFLTVIVILLLRIFWTSRSYHINMMIVFKYFVSHIFVYTLSSMIILMYQTGILTATGDPSHPIDFLLHVASILRYYQLFGCVFMLATFLCERIAATILIADYESRKRVYIPIVLLSIVSVSSFVISIGVIFFSSDSFDWSVIIGSVLVVSLTFVLSAILYYRNVGLARLLESKIDCYSLSIRFQLKENFRAFKLLLHVTLSSTIGIVVSALFLAVAVMYRENKLEETETAFTKSSFRNIEALFGQAFNVLHAIAFLFALLQHIWTEQKWKRQFKKILGISNKIEDSSKSVPVDAHAVGVAHFDTLVSSWEKRFDQHRL